MMRRLLFSCILFFFCGHGFSQEHAVTKPCAGVLINGVCWAESNVDEPGTFAALPEAYGMLYQWNRKKGWPARGEVTGWDSSLPSGDHWETVNDPCPTGWRVPTIKEIVALQDSTKVTQEKTLQNGVKGRKYTDKSTGNTIFLPAVGWRSNTGFYSQNVDICYWSSDSSNLPFLVSALIEYGTANTLGYFGYSVRCIADGNVTGCDSIVKDTSETICEGDLPYTWGDTIFQVGTKTGKYRFQRTSTVTGCDSIVYLNLTVNPSYNTILYDTICQGDSYYQHGFSLREVQVSGVHNLSLHSQAGCDSTVSLHLHVMSCSCAGVLINGVCWAESNVDEPGTFAASPEAYGMFYQWNRKKGWPARGEVTGWDSSLPSGDHWETANDPCPAGWRVPTIKEIATLQDSTKVTQEKILQNGVNGRKYTDKLTDNTIFLPAANWRNNTGFYTPNIDLCYWSSSASKQSFRVSALTEYGPGQALGSFGYSVRCIADGNVTSCDSIVKDTSETICEGDLPYTWGDTIFQAGTKTGKYRFQRTSTVTGCDSIVYLNLTVNPSYNTILYDTICQGDSYYKHGFSLREVQSSGSHSLSLLSQSGCDSIVSLHLHVMSCSCAGVLINGVCWAESNVDEPGTFAASPEAYGMFYQWNRKKGWPARGEVTGWDSSLPSGDHWEAVNDPCPAGWRVPTIKEIVALLDSTKVTQEKTLQNGVNGRKYTDKLTDNTIFLPAANWRDNTGFYKPNMDICYWSADSSNILFLVSALVEQYKVNMLGYFGFSVRCVANGNVTDCDSIVKDTSETICEGDLPYTWGDTIFQAGTKTGKYRFQRTSTVTGCDSIVYLNLTVNPSYNTILYDTICQGASYHKHGFSLREVQTSGVHNLSLHSQTGCDSTVSLHLHVMSCSCAGVLINGVCWAESNVDEPGTFAASPEAYGMFYQWNRKKGWPARGEVTGWDSSLPSGDHWETANDPCPAGWRVPTIEEITTLQDSTKVTQEKTLQNGVNGRKYTDKATSNTIFLPAVGWRSNTGYYTSNMDVCYWSADSSNLPFLVSALIEYGTANTLGYFGYSVRCIADGNVTSCDSIVKDTSETICEGDLPYTWGDTIFQAGTKTGKYRFQRTSTITGCDSIVYLSLTVNPEPHLSFTDAVCYGNGYNKNGFYLPAVFADTLVHDTLQSRGGCDSIRSLYLTVNPLYNTILYDTICQGDSYYQHGFSLANVQSGGSHTLTLLSRTGCDSTVSLHLTVLPAFHQTLYDSICPSERYVKYGFDLSDVTASGSFQLSLKTVHGCDSIVTLELYVYPTYLFTRSETICQGDTLDFRGRKLYESGVYYDSLATAKGCDSIYCLNLTVNPAYDIQLSRILCEGSSYTEHGFNVSQAGVYHRYLKTNSGCDSIITLSLTEEKKLQGNIGFLLEDCSTHTYTFFFEPEILVISYQWDMGDGTVLRSEKGIHTYADSGVYRIQLRAATLNGCENMLSYIQHVPHYLPEVVLQADRQIIDKEFPTVHFCAEVLPEMTCEWDFGDGTTGEGICVSHTYHPNTEKDYDVTLTVTNTDGCITTSRAQIEVIAFTESVNTFSPNGDGINDVFMAGYRVEIVNRNGLRVYVGDNGWDGTYNGKQAPEDTYFYRLYYQTASGERMKTGYVTLIR